MAFCLQSLVEGGTTVKRYFALFCLALESLLIAKPLCETVAFFADEQRAPAGYQEFSARRTSEKLNAHDARTEATRRARLQALLDKGELPPHFMERMRLVDPGSPAGKTFQAEMTVLFQRLFPKHDLKADPIRFLIFDEAQANAFAIPYSKPPIIAFTRGYLEKAASLDEIAITLGHEWKHHQIYREFGPGKNSKGEELWSDIDGLRWAHEAGFDIRVALEKDASARIHQTKITENLMEMLGEYNDPHPSPMNRERAAEKFIAFLDNEQGNVQGRARTPVSPVLRELGTSGKHISYVESQLAATGYATKSSREKLDTLGRLATEVTGGSRSARATDIATAIKEIPLDLKDPAQRAAVHELADRILDLPGQEGPENSRERLQSQSRHMYRALSDAVHKARGDKETSTLILGQLRELEERVKGFVNSRSGKEAGDKAADLLDWLDSHEVDAKLVRELSLPEFELPDKGDLEASWENYAIAQKKARRAKERGEPVRSPRRALMKVAWQTHYEWALEDRRGDIAAALMRLGVNDTRLFPLVGAQEGAFLHTGRAQPIRDPVSGRGNALVNLVVDTDTGHILRARKNAEALDRSLAEYAADQFGSHIRDLHEKAVKGDLDAREELIELVGHLKKNRSETLINENLALKDLELFFEINLSPLSDHTYFVPAEHGATVKSGAAELDRALKERAEMEGTSTQSFLEQQIARRENYRRNASRLMDEFSRALTSDRAGNAEKVKGFFLGSAEQSSLAKIRLEAGADFPKNSPFIEWVIADPHHLFSAAEKAQILSHSLFMRYPEEHANVLKARSQGAKLKELKVHTLEEKAAERKALCAILGCKVPTSPQELEAEVTRLGGFQSRVSDRLAALLTAEYLENPATNKSIDLVNLSRGLSHEGVGWAPGLQAKLRTRAGVWKRWPAELGAKIDAWTSLENSDIFPTNGNQRKTKLEEILEEISRVSNPKDKLRHVTALLNGPRILLPGARNRAIELWAEAHREVFGVDNGSPSYGDNIIRAAEPLLRKMSHGDRFQSAAELADALSAQKDLSFALRGIATDMNRKTLEDTHRKGVLTEHTLHVIRGDANQRDALLSFLIEPVTDASAKRTGLALRHPDLKVYFLDGRLNRNFRTKEEEAAAYSYYSKHPPSPTALAANAKLMHEDFWSSPFLVRAAMLDELLNPPTSWHSSRQESFERAFKFTADRLFPPGTLYGSEAREVLETYAKVVPEYERGVLLSAMLVAEQKFAGDSSKASVGRRLSAMLEMMGPAHVKLGQAIHSHPSTPADIQADMGRLKDSADVPARWDLFSQIETTLPDELRGRVQRVDKVLGAASYFIVAEVTMTDGKQAVLALLRPHAERRAERGFGILEKFTDAFRAEAATNDAAMRSTLRELVQQAQRMVATETSAEATAKQFETALQLYGNRRVKVGGREFVFNPVKLLEKPGPGYRLMTRAEGVHFSQLPEKTAEQVSYKKDLAKAYVALELDLILRGGKFDHDRHGSQMKVRGNEVSLFDFGAMALKEPSKEDRRALADMLVEAASGMGSGGYDAFSQAVVKSVQKRHAETGEAPEYLITAEKAVLAMGDYVKKLSPEDLKGIIAQVAMRPTVHPEISERIIERVMAEPLLMERLMGGMGGGEFPPLEIE